MAQLENINAIEKRLWNATDTLRSNSNYASNEYFLPVMGLIFCNPWGRPYLSSIRRRIKAMAGQAWHPPGRTRRFTDLILRLRSGRRSRIQIENDMFDFK